MYSEPNYPDIPELEVMLDVTLTLHKKITIRTYAYSIDNECQDEEGCASYDVDFDMDLLKNDLREQVILPQDSSLYIDVNEQPKAAEDLSGWEEVELDIEVSE